jgi:hypothetical protein
VRGEERRKKKKKKTRDTSKLQLQYYRYHIKDFNEMDSMTQKKVTNSDMSGSHLLSKASESLATFEQ